MARYTWKGIKFKSAKARSRFVRSAKSSPRRRRRRR